MAFPYKQFIRDVPDFPQPGVLFRDITPLLQDATAFRGAVEEMAGRFRNERIDAVVAVEARGYIFGAPVAYLLGAGFVPVRKVGKLPWQTQRVDYALEYGNATLEMHVDGLHRGQRVLIVDDVLATGGTLEATARLVEQSGAEVAGLVVLAELTALKGRDRLKGYRLVSLVQYRRPSFLAVYPAVVRFTPRVTCIPLTFSCWAWTPSSGGALSRASASVSWAM